MAKRKKLSLWNSELSTRRQTPSDRSLAEKRNDDIARRYVLLRDRFICISCGRNCLDSVATIGHLITSQNRRVRWDVRNIYCQCWPCNYKHEFYSEIMTTAVIDKIGLNEYNNLVIKSRQPYHKFTIDDLENIYRNLEALYIDLSRKGF